MAVILGRKPGGGGSSGGGAPSGPASGDLTGTYPGPTISTSVISAFGRTLVDDASASAARTTLGMGVAWAGYAMLREEQAANTQGGTFTSGAWRTRTLNAESFDVGSIVSLAANQFTLQAGTYFLHARAPGAQVDQHQAKLVNVTDVADVLIGCSMYARSLASVENDATVTGRFTIAGAKAFEIQHQCASTQATNGLGFACNFGVIEIYTEVQIWKEA